jgi:hypothetical protein
MQPASEEFIAGWIEGAAGVRTPGALSVEASRFLFDVVVHALNERRDETWPNQRLGLSPYRAISPAEVEAAMEGPLGDNVQILIREAAGVSAGEPIAIADLLVAINRNWCRVWPFCKAV